MIIKRNIWIYPLLTVGLAMILSNSCKKEEKGQIPVLTTSAVSKITSTTATCGGYITSDGGSKVTTRGVCWSIDPNPLIDDNKTSDGTGSMGFSSSINNLISNTTYYIRAYATNGAGTAYGSEVSFKTYGLSDADYNSYNIVTIGTQTWMAENLRTTKYSNGASIQYLNSNTAWSTQTFQVGAYCWYNDDIVNKNIYGALYNYYTVVDIRNLCPIGWHIPSDAEWATLITYLGGESLVGGKLKATSQWNSPNTCADNSSNFTAYPGGFRFSLDGTFGNMGNNGIWWSSTKYDATTAWHYYLSYNNSNFTRFKTTDCKKFGLSVRCLQD